MKASIGRIVTTLGYGSNGTNEHPAIITRVWSEEDTRNGPVCVNLTLFPDCESPKIYSSVMLFDDRAQAVAAAASSNYPVAFWPERV